MAWKCSKMIITLEGRALGRNPSRLFIISIYLTEWDINESKRKVSPRVVPSLVRNFLYKKMIRFNVFLMDTTFTSSVRCSVSFDSHKGTTRGTKMNGKSRRGRSCREWCQRRGQELFHLTQNDDSLNTVKIEVEKELKISSWIQKNFHQKKRLKTISLLVKWRNLTILIKTMLVLRHVIWDVLDSIQQRFY
jgi:hypothetical protein